MLSRVNGCIDKYIKWFFLNFEILYELKCICCDIFFLLCVDGFIFWIFVIFFLFDKVVVNVFNRDDFFVLDFLIIMILKYCIFGVNG